MTAGNLFAAMVLLTFLTARILLDELEKSLVQQQKERVDMVVKRMENELTARASTLEGFCRHIHDGERLLAAADIEKLLSTRVRLLEYFNGGIVVADQNAVAIAETIFVQGRIGTGYSDRPHVREAKEKKKSIFTRPYMGRITKTPLSTITVPILSTSGEVIGFLFGNTLLAEDNLFKELSKETLGQRGKTLIIDAELGLVVTASDASMAMQPLPERGSSAVLDSVLSGASGGKIREHTGDTLLYATATLDKMGWQVIHMLPAEGLMGKGASLIFKISLLIASTMVLISLLILLYLRKELLPLKKAADTINAMAEGRMPAQPLPLVRMDEVGKLCLAFNRLHALREEKAQELKEERDFLKSQFLQSSDGIALLDPETFHILESNPRLSEILGVPQISLAGQSVLGLLDTDRENLQQRFERVSSLPDTRPVEYSILHPESRKVHVVISATRVRKGDQACIMANVRDITEQKQALEMKNEFVSTVSHELRTPLTAISGALGLLMGEALGKLPEKAEGILKIAHSNCRRLSMLINDLLDMEKLSAGKLRFDFSEVDLLLLVKKSLEDNAAYAEKFGIRLRLESPPNPIFVHVDPQRLLQVLANLLSNAIKFSPEGEEVLIRISHPDSLRVRLAVEDRGEGIPEEFRSRIFQKFSQLDATDRRSREGTGLGLAITKALVETMKGCIDFASEKGKGSIFYLDLPLLNAEQMPRDCLPPETLFPPPAPFPDVAEEIFQNLQEKSRMEKPRLLVAEEDRDVALLLQDLLERSGYTVLRVADHTEIREELKKGSYAALIQDLLLPDGKGLDLIRHLRADPETRAIPIVGISASVKEGRLVLRGAFNTIDWLEKPFDPEKLLKIVEKAIRQQKGIKPRILHVEDDPDLAQILATIGEDLAIFDLAPSLAKAREKLAQQSYTLIILDIALPDGSGWELLPLLKTLKPAPPVVLLSSSEPGRSQSQTVEAVLTKGKVSNTDILETLKAILKDPESSHES